MLRGHLVEAFLQPEEMNKDYMNIQMYWVCKYGELFRWNYLRFTNPTLFSLSLPFQNSKAIITCAFLLYHAGLSETAFWWECTAYTCDWEKRINVFLVAIIACFFNCVFKENFLGSTLFIWERLLQILIFLLFFWGNPILTWSIAFFKYHNAFLHLPYIATKVNIKA